MLPVEKGHSGHCCQSIEKGSATATLLEESVQLYTLKEEKGGVLEQRGAERGRTEEREREHAANFKSSTGPLLLLPPRSSSPAARTREFRSTSAA